MNLSTKNPAWQEAFDKEAKEFWIDDLRKGDITETLEHIEIFINRLLQSEREKWEREILRELSEKAWDEAGAVSKSVRFNEQNRILQLIEGMRKDEKFLEDTEYHKGYFNGFHQALDALREKLTKNE